LNNKSGNRQTGKSPGTGNQAGFANNKVADRIWWRMG